MARTWAATAPGDQPSGTGSHRDGRTSSRRGAHRPTSHTIPMSARPVTAPARTRSATGPRHGAAPTAGRRERRAAEHARRRRTLVERTVCCAMALGSGWLLWSSSQSTPAPAAPVPAHPFTAPSAEPEQPVPTVAAPVPMPDSRPADQVRREQEAAARTKPDESFVDLGEPDSATASLDKPPTAPDAGRPALATMGAAPTTGDAVERMGANRLYVPSVGIYGRVVTGGAAKGEMELPLTVNRVAWYTRSAPLSATGGTTLIAGHNSYNGVVGTMAPLYRLSPNATVYVTDKDRRITKWRVVSLQSYRKGEIPAQDFATSGPRRLVLVTCGGELRQTDHGRHYEDNVVAVAVPAS